MHRPILTILMSIAVLFAGQAAAQAATPFTAGSGGPGSAGLPDVAVGSDGTGHVVWVTGGNAQVRYCRVAPGGADCNRTDSFSFGPSLAANRAGRAAVFTPEPNKVVVVAACWNCPNGGTRTYRWVSIDNGTSFVPTSAGPAGQIGEGFSTEGAGTWLEDTGVFVAASSRSVKATDGAPYAPGLGVPYADSGFTYDPQVVRLPGTNTLVAAANNLDVVEYGVFLGGSLIPSSINEPINWNRELTLPAAEADNSDTSLNSGPVNGVYLSYLSQAPGGAQVRLRHFDPVSKTFGAPVYVQGSDPIDANGLDYPDSYQDAAGRIHMVWRSLHDGGRLRYRVSDTSGTNFGPVGNIATAEAFTDPQVAAGPAGTGFAAWRMGTSDAVRVVALDPQPEPSPPGPGAPGTPGGPSGPGGPGGPAGPVPTVSRTAVGDRTLRPGQGTTFTFVASKAGRAVLTIEKKFKGLKIKRKVKTKSGKRVVRRVCVVRTKKRLRALRRRAKSNRAYRRAVKRRTCRGFRRVGKISRPVRAGRNSIRFNGRVAGRKLGRGVYRAKLVITDSAGQRSRAEALRFKVVGKQQKKARGRRGTGRRR